MDKCVRKSPSLVYDGRWSRDERWQGRTKTRPEVWLQAEFFFWWDEWNRVNSADWVLWWSCTTHQDIIKSSVSRYWTRPNEDCGTIGLRVEEREKSKRDRQEHVWHKKKAPPTWSRQKQLARIVAGGGGTRWQRWYHSVPLFCSVRLITRGRMHVRRISSWQTRIPAMRHTWNRKLASMFILQSSSKQKILLLDFLNEAISPRSVSRPFF